MVAGAPGWSLSLGRRAVTVPVLQLIVDPTDTWSHGVRTYGVSIAEPVWEKPELIETGPLRSALIQTGKIGQSRLQAEWRVEANASHAELLLRVFWSEKHKLLKLTLPLPASAKERIDGVMGGMLVRPNDGRELPLRDWTRVTCGGNTLGVVAPDIYALDGDGGELRFTLLRSPLMAHHDPQPPEHPRGVVSDQGEHIFRFCFFLGETNTEQLDRHSLQLQQPPLLADLTKGMPTRFPSF